MRKLPLKINKLYTLFLKHFYYPILLKLNKNLKYCNSLKGHLYFNEGISLFRLAQKLPRKSIIVEIGSYLGKATCFLAEGIKNRDIILYTIDTFENQGMTEGLRDTYNEFKQNTLRYRNCIVVKRGFSHEIVKDFKNMKIDLLWIDACHEYNAVKKDIEDWVPLVKEGGLICFHDYYINGPNDRVKKAVNEAISKNQIRKIIMVGHRMIITRKQNIS